MIRLTRAPRTVLALWGLMLLADAGCVHRIHVTPTPPATAERTIRGSVQVTLSFLWLEGADHMPGIGQLDWPAKDLRAATISYLEQRRTFLAVGEEPGDFTMVMRAWLTVKSRQTYMYKLRLESDIGPAGKPPVKSYVAEKEAAGSTVRWVTASDQDPIRETVQAALDDLVQQIERDASLYGNHRN